MVIGDSVTSIGDSVFSGCSSLTSVVIGDSVTSIDFYAFYSCSSLTSVYYKGTASDWSQISIGSYNTKLTNATRYYYSESQPTSSGNYWHYDENGNVAVWERWGDSTESWEPESSMEESSLDYETSSEEPISDVSSEDYYVESSSENRRESSEEETSSQVESSEESSVESSEESSIESSEEESSESSVQSSEEESSEGLVESPEESSSEEDSSVVVVVPSVSQGDDRHEMPIYEGEATAIGYPAGTEPIYQLTATTSTAWDNRIIINVEEDADYVKFDVVFSIDNASLIIWPGPNGSYNFSASGVTSSDIADSTRRILLLDADGCQPTSWKANTLYTIYFYLNDDDPSVQFNSFKDMTTYVANIEFGNSDVVAKYAIVQGDQRVAMPKYDGDVTELGFAEGTTVYALENPDAGNWGSNVWTMRTIISAPATQDYITIEFVSENDIDTNPFHLWGVAGVPSIGSVGFATRDIGLITDMNGYMVTSIEAGQHYLLHIACEGLSEVQIGSVYGVNTVYFGNITYNNGTFTEN